MKFRINKYIRKWISEDGYYLEIMKIDESHAKVSFCQSESKSVLRPYYVNKPTMKRSANYDDCNDTLIVELWKEGKGFCLQLDYEYTYLLDKLKRDSLVPGISRNKEDNFLDEYYQLFGNLKHFTKFDDIEK